MTKQSSRYLPAELAGVALINGATAAATGGMCLSWWLSEVAAGRAPAPAIRAPRCTRWLARDVARYWEQRAATGADSAAATAMIVKATRASAAAKARRCAKPAGA